MKLFNMLCAAAVSSALLFVGPAFAQQKTVKQCNEEWTANKATLQANGTKKKDFIAQCRSGGSTATAPSASQNPAASPPNRTSAAPATTPNAAGTSRAATATATGAGEFTTEAQAKAHCPSDTVVWANLSSKVYHFSGNRNYGTTKSGAYMCEKDSTAAGFRAAKNEKHP
jgi:hypothetical protein